MRVFDFLSNTFTLAFDLLISVSSSSSLLALRLRSVGPPRFELGLSGIFFLSVGMPGFEPGLNPPEGLVLPLHYIPILKVPDVLPLHYGPFTLFYPMLFFNLTDGFFFEADFLFFGAYGKFL